MKNRYRKKNKKRSSSLKLYLTVLLLFIAFTACLIFLGKQKHGHDTTITENAKKDTPSPKFDFYTTLPQNQNSSTTAEYELEIATVKTFAAADKLKAELALLGFTTSITPVRKNGVQKYYVSIGPYNNNNTAISDIERLKQNKIKSVLKKLH